MRKKVLITASVYIHIRNFHLPYIRRFNELGWEVDVACANCPEEICGVANAINLPFEKSITSLRNLKATAILKKQIKKSAYDLVICHTSLAAFFTRLAVIGMKKRPAICNVVHGYLFDDNSPQAKRLMLAAAEKLTAPVTDLIITMNRFDTEYAKAHKLSKRVTCVGGIGLDTSKLTESTGETKASIRKKLGFKKTDFVLLYAAEFSDRKSQQVLIKAMPQLAANVLLALPGDGALLDECKAISQKLAVEEQLRFPGYISNMSEWFSACDVVVSASRSEGLPFNIMEAMHYARPVVASAVKGHTDLVEDGVNGYLYPYGDSAAFADRIKQLMAKPDEAQSFGESSRSLVKKYYIENILPEIMALYESTAI